MQSFDFLYKNIHYTTWKISALFEGTNPHFFVLERENGLLKALLSKAFKITLQVAYINLLSSGLTRTLLFTHN